MFSNNNVSRTRRHSGSFSPLVAPVTVTNSWGPRLTPRVNQLRAEECADVSNTREVAHEREVHSAMQMGQSCEDLTLVSGLANSPTRLHRFSPVVSPSPTRKYTTRRSLSPIAIRASSFSPVSSRPNMFVAKRRCDETDSPLSKRMCTSDRLTPSTPGTPDSDSLECTFRPVSPRAQPMNESPHESQDNHKSPNPS
ncbi:P2R1A-PPP2R2A-interacting phosphatase regulator 1 isoform X2 [Galleria mellonella]|nr:P2R1A-PPP2R2A-interacting phosphatase regulator 1 isoform X2 [Galleria mellonella]